MTYGDVCGTRTLPTAYPGHLVDLTYMSAGGIRVECSCGWWEDHTATGDESAEREAPALEAVKTHTRSARPIYNTPKSRRTLSLSDLFALR
jgi:hypothetical protein